MVSSSPHTWGLIQAVPSPPTVNIPTPSYSAFKPQPLPDGIPGKGAVAFFKLVAVVVAVAIIVSAPGLWFIGLLAGWIGWALATSAGSSQRAAERTKRRSTFQAAKQEYDRLVERAKKEAGPEGFHARKVELAQLRDELENLPQAEKQELDKLHATAHDRQKRKFLDTCFIDSADIPGVGPARKAALRSFGIETAADVTRNGVRKVRGFGESLTRAVLDWKASCERRFRFNPASAVSAADINAVKTKHAAKRTSLEQRLAAGPAQLQQFRQNAAKHSAAFYAQLEAAAQKLAQAHVDLSLIE